MDSVCSFTIDDHRAAESLPKEDNIMEKTKEEIKKPVVETASVEVQTDYITEGELLSLQQQKM